MNNAVVKPVKFVHVRAENPDTWEIAPKGGVTAAIFDTDVPLTYYVTFSICNPSDHYVKQIGRELCVDNYENSNGLYIYNVKNIAEAESRVRNIAEQLH